MGATSERYLKTKQKRISFFRKTHKMSLFPKRNSNFCFPRTTPLYKVKQGCYTVITFGVFLYRKIGTDRIVGYDNKYLLKKKSFRVSNLMLYSLNFKFAFNLTITHKTFSFRNMQDSNCNVAKISLLLLIR